MFRTNNPTLSDRVFSQYAPAHGSQVMTLQGTAFKGGVLALLALGSAMWTWGLVHQGVTYTAGTQAAMPWMLGGLAVAVVAGLTTSFVPRWAALTAPIYALGEGLVLGTVSAMADLRVPGVVLQAGSLTLLTLVSLAVVYQMGWIRATRGFVMGLSAAMGAIGLMYLVSFVMNIMGMSIPYIHGSGPIGIGVSVVVVIVAALNLILDFDQIERGVRYGAPKYMEWYGAFGLMVTLVWLYVEILRLLLKLADRRN